MSEKLCALKKKGGGSNETEISFEPISTVAQFATQGLVFDSNLSSKLQNTNTYNGPDFSFSYGSTTWTVKAVTSGVFVAIGSVGKTGNVKVEKKYVNAGEVIAKFKFSDQNPTQDQFIGGICFKVQ